MLVVLDGAIANVEQPTLAASLPGPGGRAWVCAVSDAVRDRLLLALNGQDTWIGLHCAPRAG